MKTLRLARRVVRHVGPAFGLLAALVQIAQFVMPAVCPHLGA